MKRRMAIITSYVEGESYGMLGPQMAATVIQENTSYECQVIAVPRDFDMPSLINSLADYFGNTRPIIGFSTLSGREDLFSLAKILKEDGAITILAGPQAHVDYAGEINWQNHPHRFRGLSECFSLSIHGPAEQAVSLLQNVDKGEWREKPGVLYLSKQKQSIRNPQKGWDENHLNKVRWDNIFMATKGGQLIPIEITIAQVLQQIGCPHAGHKRWVEIDYPASFKDWEDKKVRIPTKGCSFCDVAVDKGFYGELRIDAVLRQIHCLPEDKNGRKIPFELINENPLPKLPRLLHEIDEKKLSLSQINLILRADWFIKGEAQLKEALHKAEDMGIRILASSIGFEAFDDRLLRNFNKGTSVEINLQAIRLMRRLKKDFPETWGYSRDKGAIHGFIHPTPWDTRETEANTQKNISIYGLSADILPPHSTPLIIHHSSALGQWIREVENREGIHYKRYGSVIGWWDVLEEASLLV